MSRDRTDTHRLPVTGLLAAAVLAGSTPGALADREFDLIWADEFDDLFVNPANWEPMIGNGQAYGIAGWGNNELQYYTSRVANMQIQNGALQIIARRENFQGYDYTSARLRTKDRFAARYGRIEARIKLPTGDGVWPAFWMLPEDNVYGGWPLSGEIDIMEMFGNPNYISGAIHFGNAWPNRVFISQGRSGQWGGNWVVYRIEWEPNWIRWYVNDILYFAADNTDWFTGAAPADPDAPFDQDFHLLLNVAVGGNPLPNPTPASVFPQTMEVDWVRWYQELQSPFGVEPAPIPGRIEAEDFDEGYQGQAFYDADPLNVGLEYRIEESVDIQQSSDGGYNVGWMRPGEWIEYTVDVQQPGPYRVSARVASQSSGGSFRLLFDGQDVGADFTVPPTGGWQSYTSVPVEIDLPAGETVMRFENLGGQGQEFNISYWDFEFLGTSCPADLAPPFGVLDLADITAFTSGFLAQDPSVDLAEPFGVFDLSDISAFTTSFLAGCP
jgi:beta-glucanase (GH16 family)